MKRHILAVAVCISFLAVSAGAVAETSSGHAAWEARAVLGPKVTMGDGWVRSRVEFGSKDNPVSLGVVFDKEALLGLPKIDREYIVPMPTGVTVAPVNHIAVDWNVHGHVPPGVYNAPHFDFHFYMITPEARDRITATGPDLSVCDKQPESRYMPQGYILPPGTEFPRMGAHAVNPSWPEFNGQKFTRSFIYGYYDGQLVFFEPMITRAYLLSGPSMTQRIAVPAAYARPGWYPTMYSVRFDGMRREYLVSVEGLAFRK